MRSMNEISMKEYNLEMDFSKLCQRTEQSDRQALLRFRSWFKGLTDPAEDAAYHDTFYLWIKGTLLWSAYDEKAWRHR